MLRNSEFLVYYKKNIYSVLISQVNIKKIITIKLFNFEKLFFQYY